MPETIFLYSSLSPSRSSTLPKALASFMDPAFLELTAMMSRGMFVMKERWVGRCWAWLSRKYDMRVNGEIIHKDLMRVNGFEC